MVEESGPVALWCDGMFGPLSGQRPDARHFSFSRDYIRGVARGKATRLQNKVGRRVAIYT